MFDRDLKAIEVPRVIPLHALVSAAFVGNKVRNKDAVEVYVTVEIGLMRYRTKQWMQETSFILEIPRKQAAKLAAELSRKLGQRRPT